MHMPSPFLTMWSCRDLTLPYGAQNCRTANSTSDSIQNIIT